MPNVYFSEIGETLTLTSEQWKCLMADLHAQGDPNERLRRLLREPSILEQRIAQLSEKWADWLVDAVAMATQDRRYLRGEPEEDKVATEAIYLNGKKAIESALRAMQG